MLREKSKVVWVKSNAPSPERLENSTAILQRMIEVGLKELTGTEEPTVFLIAVASAMSPW